MVGIVLTGHVLCSAVTDQTMPGRVCVYKYYPARAVQPTLYHPVVCGVLCRYDSASVSVLTRPACTAENSVPLARLNKDPGHEEDHQHTQGSRTSVSIQVGEGRMVNGGLKSGCECESSR